MVKKTENRKGFWTTSLGKALSFLGKYTGISWLLSGLKRVFDAQPQKFSDTSFIAEGGGELYLLPTEAHNRTLNESVKKSKFRVSISTDKRKCNITGSGPYVTSEARLCYKISSVESRDHDESDKLKKMKGKLGFIGETKTIEVTNISEAPEVESPASTVSYEVQLTKNSEPIPQQSFITVTNQGQLRLFTAVKHMAIVGLSTNPNNKNEYLVYLTIGKNTYCITGNGPDFTSNTLCYNISSVANQDGTDASNDPAIMMEKLGLVGETKFLEVTEVTKAPFKIPEAAHTNPSPGKEPRSTSGDPKLQQLTTGKTKSGSGP